MATNKKGLTARIAAGLGAAAIATFAVVGGATPAFAAANIDSTVSASITIHMHEQTGAAGSTGTGSPTDPVAGPTIEGVEFSIRAVTSLDVQSNSTWTTLDGLTAADVAADTTTYPLGQTVGTNAWTAITGTDGTVRQAVPQGVYYVEQLSAPSAAGVVIRSQPFLVVVPQAVEATSTWNYNVHVYPKTAVSDAIKTLEAFDQEGLGGNLTWNLDVAVPVASEGRTLQSFGIVDNLDPRLSHDLADLDAVRVTVGTTTLVRGTDFTVALSGQALSIDFRATGITALVNNPDQRVAVEIDTTITGMGSGTVSNTATVSVNGTQIPSNTATAYFGGIQLQKNDDKGATLQGAIFEVLDADRNVVTINGVSEFTSDANGVVAIVGLRTNAAGNETYTVREKSAPAGYLLGQVTEWSLPVPVGTHATVAPIVNAQVPAYALPITGGSGQAAFMIGGAGLLASALGFALFRRRKADAEV